MKPWWESFACLAFRWWIQDRLTLYKYLLWMIWGLMDTSVPFVTDHHGNVVNNRWMNGITLLIWNAFAKQGIFFFFFMLRAWAPSQLYYDRAECSPASYYKLIQPRITTVLHMDRWLNYGKGWPRNNLIYPMYWNRRAIRPFMSVKRILAV